MKGTGVLAGVLVAALAAVQADAQLHYDPYYSLARDVGAKSANLGLTNSDLSKVGDTSDLGLMGKYMFSEKFEAGGRVTLGLLQEGADDLQSVVVGVKDVINDYSAATLNVLLPVGGVEDPGLSLGYMRTLVSENLKVNTHVQLGFLEGYTFSSEASDIAIAVLIQPARHFGEKAIGYVDLLLDTNTSGDIGDNFGLNVIPQVDFEISKSSVLNLGISVGVAGDNKQEELGMRAAYKVTLK